MTERMRVGLLLAVAIIVYLNALPNGFTFDDSFYVLNNPAVVTVSLGGLFQPTRNNVFRPTTMASFALNWAAAGARPFGFHLVNVLLHAGAAVLLYLVLGILLESVPHGTIIAFATALLFAVHPLHTEAVASIAARSELLAAGLLLAAWFVHLNDKPISALLCFLLALSSKESAVTFVVLVLAGDYARGKWKAAWRYGSIAGLAGLYLVLFWTIEGGRFGERDVFFLDNPLASFPTQLRILNAFRIAWKYVALLVYPATLSYDYSYNAIRLYATWRHAAIAVVATLAVVAVWIWAARNRRNAWFMAGAIYFGSFASTANFLIPTGTVMGERLAYLPSAGFCLLVALIWSQLVIRRSAVGWAVLGIILAALSVRTMIRNQDWKNNFTLFYAGVQAVPGSARAHRNLADEYVRRGQLEEAAREFQNALRIYPEYPEAVENYGLAEARMGNAQEARKLLETAVSLTSKVSPDYTLMKVNLARHLMTLGQMEDALKLLNEAIAASPGYALAWSSRAVIRYQRGEIPSARSDAETALRLDPSNSQALALLDNLNAPAGATSTR